MRVAVSFLFLFTVKRTCNVSMAGKEKNMNRKGNSVVLARWQADGLLSAFL
jgi:hypothetical protein